MLSGWAAMLKPAAFAGALISGAPWPACGAIKSSVNAWV